MDPYTFTLTSSVATLYDAAALSEKEIVSGTKNTNTGISNCRHSDGMDTHCISGILRTSYINAAGESVSGISSHLSLSDISQFDLAESYSKSSETSPMSNLLTSDIVEMCQSSGVSMNSPETDSFLSECEVCDPNRSPSALVPSLDTTSSSERGSPSYVLVSSERDLEHPAEGCCQAELNDSLSSSDYHNVNDAGSHSSYVHLGWPANRTDDNVSDKMHLPAECSLADHNIIMGSDSNLNACSSNAAVLKWSPGTGNIICHQILCNSEPIIPSSNAIPPQVFHGSGSDYMYIQ